MPCAAKPSMLSHLLHALGAAWVVQLAHLVASADSGLDSRCSYAPAMGLAFVAGGWRAWKTFAAMSRLSEGGQPKDAL
jgi:hypothetical protein